MPLYYFHIKDGDGRIADEEGLDLLDLNRALEEGRKSARSLASQRQELGQHTNCCVVEVVDEAGKLIVTIPVRTVLH